jgi:hypothetical protein
LDFPVAKAPDVASSLDGTAAGAAAGSSTAPGRGGDATQGTSPFIVDFRVGRLLEIRVWHLRCVDEMLSLSAGLASEARKLSSPPIIFADYRRSRPFPQDVADAWSRCMRAFNKSVALSAILLDPSNETFNLQLERVVRCACNPSRRAFCDPRELRDWFARMSTTEELARLDDLLTGGGSPFSFEASGFLPPG